MNHYCYILLPTVCHYQQLSSTWSPRTPGPWFGSCSGSGDCAVAWWLHPCRVRHPRDMSTWHRLVLGAFFKGVIQWIYQHRIHISPPAKVRCWERLQIHRLLYVHQRQVLSEAYQLACNSCDQEAVSLPCETHWLCKCVGMIIHAKCIRICVHIHATPLFLRWFGRSKIHQDSTHFPHFSH